MQKNTLKIVSRSSQLALVQTQTVIDLLKDAFPEYQYDIVPVITKGDQVLDTALAQIGDKGLFTKELEEKLITRECDFAVHSAKDLPTTLPEPLILAPFLCRESPYDVLISSDHVSLLELDAGSKVGTSSLRRVAQLKRVRSDLEYVSIRGNLNTRIRKLEEGQYQAIVLASAGLKRLGLEDLITEYLDILIPAVGQGALAIEYHPDNILISEMFMQIGHMNTTVEVKAERAFLKSLQGGCQVPIGALATIQEKTLSIKGFISNIEGTKYLESTVSGFSSMPEILGEELAKKLIDQGALEIIKSLY